MKRVVGLFVFIVILSLVSSASINLNDEYKKGETIIAEIGANFINPLETSNIFFYRGHTTSPFDFELGKIGEKYYLKISTIGKDTNNYTLKIEDANYYSAGEIVDTPIEKNFTINSDIAEFYLNKGFVTEENDFTIYLTSLSDVQITIDISTPDQIQAQDSVILSPGQIKSIEFSISSLEQDLETAITFSSGDTSYEIPVYLIATEATATCGNEIIEFGELCDGENFGNISGCEDYGFSSGEISCIVSGNPNECTFDTSGCFNESGETAECGNDILESGEQCDTDTFGSIDSCKDFGYDSGKLMCDNDCTFDKSDCYDYEECDGDNDCNDGYECDKGDCVKKDNYCKDEDNCDNDERCYKHECIDKEDYCEDDEDCGDEFCYDHECVECKINSNCDKGKVCNDKKKCVDYIECDKNNPCGPDKICISNECIEKETQNSCDDLGGKICANDENCEGDSQEINNRTCCISSECKEKEESSTGKIIGWVLLGLIVIGLILFYFKYKKTKRKNPDLKKIATSPRVKNNLLR